MSTLCAIEQRECKSESQREAERVREREKERKKRKRERKREREREITHTDHADHDNEMPDQNDTAEDDEMPA